MPQRRSCTARLSEFLKEVDPALLPPYWRAQMAEIRRPEMISQFVHSLSSQDRARLKRAVAETSHPSEAILELSVALLPSERQSRDLLQVVRHAIVNSGLEAAWKILFSTHRRHLPEFLADLLEEIDGRRRMPLWYKQLNAIALGKLGFPIPANQRAAVVRALEQMWSRVPFIALGGSPRTTAEFVRQWRELELSPSSVRRLIGCQNAADAAVDELPGMAKRNQSYEGWSEIAQEAFCNACVAARVKAMTKWPETWLPPVHRQIATLREESRRSRRSITTVWTQTLDRAGYLLKDCPTTKLPTVERVETGLILISHVNVARELLRFRSLPLVSASEFHIMAPDLHLLDIDQSAEDSPCRWILAGFDAIKPSPPFHLREVCRAVNWNWDECFVVRIPWTAAPTWFGRCPPASRHAVAGLLGQIMSPYCTLLRMVEQLGSLS